VLEKVPLRYAPGPTDYPELGHDPIRNAIDERAQGPGSPYILKALLELAPPKAVQKVFDHVVQRPDWSIGFTILPDGLHLVGHPLASNAAGAVDDAFRKVLRLNGLLEEHSEQDKTDGAWSTKEAKLRAKLKAAKESLERHKMAQLVLRKYMQGKLTQKPDKPWKPIAQIAEEAKGFKIMFRPDKLLSDYDPPAKLFGETIGWQEFMPREQNAAKKIAAFENRYACLPEILHYGCWKSETTYGTPMTRLEPHKHFYFLLKTDEEQGAQGSADFGKSKAEIEELAGRGWADIGFHTHAIWDYNPKAACDVSPDEFLSMAANKVIFRPKQFDLMVPYSSCSNPPTVSKRDCNKRSFLAGFRKCSYCDSLFDKRSQSQNKCVAKQDNCGPSQISIIL